MAEQRRDDRPTRAATASQRSRKGVANPTELDLTAELSSFRNRPDDEGLSLDGFGGGDERYSTADDPYESSATSGSHSPALSATAADADFPVTPRAIVEAILFVGHPSSEGLTSRFLAALMRGVRPAEIDALVLELNEEYTRLGCPYTIVSGTSGYRLVLRDEYLNLRESFYGKVREAKLSQAAIDALAVIAYRQPITREAILSICDSATPALLAQLVRRGLLTVERTGPGASGWQYSTSDRFLEMFGLQALSDLPRPQGEEAPID